MTYGFWGKVLRVDLTKEKIVIDSVRESFFKKYLGGVGIGTKLLFDTVDPSVDPFDPESVLIFSVGPFQGTIIPGSGRWVVVSRSPLTGIYADSSAGGTWGPLFKRAGFDALVITGRAAEPVYLWISDGNVEIKDASSVWGKTTSEADEIIKKDLGELNAAVACIGPAGENLVRFASIINEHGVAGRAGIGAVMGSKNLKAVAAMGSRNLEVARPGELDDLSKKLFKEFYEKQKDGMRVYGSCIANKIFYETSEIGMKYWTQGTWDEASNLYPENIKDALSWSPVACLNCPIACHKSAKVEEPKKFAYKGYGPEYESVGMLGALCLISDPKAVGYMHYLCDEYGMDVITAGGLIAFSMECYEKGLLSKEDLDGLDLKWGNAEAATALLHKIAKKEGFGAVLAEGIRKAADFVGKDAPRIAMHVKGLDIPAHDPRAFFPWSINYATSPRGACHQRGFAGWMGLGVVIPEWGIAEKTDRHSMEGAANIAAKYQDWATIFNSLVQCEYMTFAGLTLTDQVKLLNYVTGWDVDIEWMAKTAERIFTLQRVINVIYGVGRKDDTLPMRMFEPLKTGGSKGKIPVPFEKELLEYYHIRGWDSDGRPTKEKLVELGLIEALKPVWEGVKDKPND